MKIHRWMPALERLMLRRVVTETGCWEWNGWRTRHGYGQISVAGKKMPAHCAAYVLLIGPIPDDHVIHHACKNRSCFNPAHLMPLTALEHGGEHAPTHCIHGHPFDTLNTYRCRDGSRMCRTCDRENLQRWRRENPDRYRAQWRRSNAKRWKPRS